MKRFLIAITASGLVALATAAQAGQQPTFPTDDCDSHGCTQCEYASDNEIVCEEFSWLEIILIFSGDQVPGADGFQTEWLPPEPPIPPVPATAHFVGRTLPPPPPPPVPTRTAPR